MSARPTSPITIIGGGIVGCSIAYELAKRGYSDITVLERNETIPGLNQSSTNEGAIHAGVYYPPEIMPLKAQLCVEGNALLYEFLTEHNLPHQKTGKLIVATTDSEEQYLDYLLGVGQRNGVPEIKKITGAEALELEPNLKNVTGALHVPTTGCASPEALIKKIKSLALSSGVKFRLGVIVTALTPRERSCTVTTKTETGTHRIETEFLINSAGLYADEIALMINAGSTYEIEPVRGEFAEFDKSERAEIGMSGLHVYQPPYCYTTEDGVMKIVKLTPAQLTKRMASGSVKMTAGVHLSPVYKKMREGYALGDTVTISPLKTVGLGKEDYTSGLHSKADYIEKVRDFFPRLNASDINLGHTGIMATLKNHNDFVIERDSMYPHCINLIGMDSPAWTACLAIGSEVCDRFF